jgi:hypothetical protein
MMGNLGEEVEVVEDFRSNPVVGVVTMKSKEHLVKEV